jgi:hypothetical protein
MGHTQSQVSPPPLSPHSRRDHKNLPLESGQVAIYPEPLFKGKPMIFGIPNRGYSGMGMIRPQSTLGISIEIGPHTFLKGFTSPSGNDWNNYEFTHGGNDVYLVDSTDMATDYLEIYPIRNFENFNIYPKQNDSYFLWILLILVIIGICYYNFKH